MINEEIIKNWGVPKSIKDKKIKFRFNNENLKCDSKDKEIVKNLDCYDRGSKFCLYDIENDKIILTMDFFIPRSFRGTKDTEKEIKLQCLYINDSEMRRKGIATYYLEKVIEFGISNDINKFRLSPNPEAEEFENLDKRKTLSLKDLNDFYIRKFEKFGFKYEYLFTEDDEVEQIIFEK